MRILNRISCCRKHSERRGIMESQHRTLAICFGAISALGPLALDMYLSAMPVMAEELGAAEGRIELTVMAFFVGFCLGQLVMGPLSDKVGRKPVVIAGLILFGLASVACVFAATVEQFIGFRVVQGVGGSVGMAIAMAAIRDLFTGAMAARLLSMVIMVLGLAPIIAPILGSVMLMVLPWQAIFWFQAVLTALILLAVIFLLPETRTPDARHESHPLRALATYARLLVRQDYISFAGVMALAQAGFFGYLTAASVVLISTYGLSPLTFSIVFAANAIGLAIGSQIGGRLAARFGALKVARHATLFRGVVAVVLAAVALTGLLSLPVFIGLCFLLIASLGLVMPCCSVLALEHQGRDSGTASALMGALGFGFGSVISLLVGMMADGTAVPVSILLAGTALISLLISTFAFPKAEPGPAT